MLKQFNILWSITNEYFSMFNKAQIESMFLSWINQIYEPEASASERVDLTGIFKFSFSVQLKSFYLGSQ